MRYHIVGLVDDDRAKHGLMIHGVKVLGGRETIPAVVRAENVDSIVIAIQTVSGQDLREILSICMSTSASIKRLPGVFQRFEGSSEALPLRDLGIEDLVGREQVSIDLQACRQLLAGKTVLVTGAAGSVGSELCRQIVQFQPRLLVMLDQDETGLHDLALDLRARLRGLGDASAAASSEDALSRCRYVLADITRRTRMQQVFRQYRPEIILHSAAYKHVPLMEQFPEEALRVNVGGTLVLLDLARAFGSERFVFISTDKSVEPTCMLGVSKWMGEVLVTQLPRDGPPIATAVRFGNVLGSRGSVACIFQRQIDAGGPVTVTHPAATRFFMSVSEAASMVLQAASMAQGGEVFILEMGEQIRISDLAHKMIRLHGLRVGQDIAVVHTDLRPGEKLHEKLVADHEVARPTSHPEVLCVQGDGGADREGLLEETNLLLQALDEGMPTADLRARLFELARAHGAHPAGDAARHQEA